MSGVVYFDLDGTLVEFDRPYGEIVTGAFRSAGVPDAERVVDAYGDRFFHHFDAFADDPYCRALADAFETCDVDGDPDSVAEALIAAELDATTLRDGAREVVAALEERTTIGVLTNGVPAVQRAKLERLDLTDAFDAIVVSYEVGAHKPDPAIFEAARDRLDADEYVYIGDSYDHDIEPAREAGFLGVHLDDTAEGPVTVSGFEHLLAIGRRFST